MLKQRCLVLDIETWPIIAAVFDTKDVNIANNQIRTDTSVMAWGAKWLGTPASEVIYRDSSKQRNLREDKALLAPIWKLLDEADIIITQNGQSFDGPKLNWRFMVHKMGAPSPYRHLDTYRISKRVAKATSHKLEYLTDKLNVKYKKLTHKNFPGMELWNECEVRNAKAWAEMKKYNIHDVLSTEELYLNLQPWIPDTMPKIHVTPTNVRICGTCGSNKVVSNGLRYANKAVYQRLHCLGCGIWSKGEKKDLDK